MTPAEPTALEPSAPEQRTSPAVERATNATGATPLPSGSDVADETAPGLAPVEDADVEIDPADVIEAVVLDDSHTPAEGDQAPGPARSRLTVDRERTHRLFLELQSVPPDDLRHQRARDALVEQHLPLVEHLARRFRNRGEPYDDLVQVATIGLIKSVDRFDLERGVEFSTYATPTIVGEIKRHFRDKGWAVRVPRRLQELRLALASATSELSQRQGRSPTVSELAAHMKISDEEVLEGLESANAYSTLSLDAGDSGSGDEPMPVSETLGMEDEGLEGVEYRESLKPMLELLPAREKKILMLRFFRNMTQSEIANEIGISQMHVSRLLARTLAQLREGLLVDE